MTLELKQIIEALLFSAERPLSPKEIRAIFAEATDEENSPAVSEPFRNVREAQIVATLDELKAECELQQHSYQLVEIAGGWRLVTRPEYAPWLKKLLDEARPHRLSPPSLETLAIIALRQPISRADIAAIRGVEVDGVIKTLLERDMITIVGKSNAPGRPMLYGTTQKFLEHFGLRDIEQTAAASAPSRRGIALLAARTRSNVTAAEASGQRSRSGTLALDVVGAGRKPEADRSRITFLRGGKILCQPRVLSHQQREHAGGHGVEREQYGTEPSTGNRQGVLLRKHHEEQALAID